MSGNTVLEYVAAAGSAAAALADGTGMLGLVAVGCQEGRTDMRS